VRGRYNLACTLIKQLRDMIELERSEGAVFEIAFC
jgi:hypothetical protein